MKLPKHLLLLILVLAPAALWADMPFYTLVCRGGDLTRYSVSYGQPYPISPPGVVLEFEFFKGRQAAHLGIEPGQCTFQDRGLRDSEPANLYVWQKLGNKQHYKLSFQNPNGVLVRAEGRNLKENVVLQDLSNFISSVGDESKYVYFQVRNRGESFEAKFGLE